MPGLKILYINTGSGHKSQASAIAEAAHKKGLDAEIVNFSDIAAPGNQGKYEEAYGHWLKSPHKTISGLNLGVQHLKYYLIDSKRDKVDKFIKANKDNTIILAHPHLQHPFAHVEKKLFVLHTDPVNWPMNTDVSAKGERVHLGTKDVLEEIKPRAGQEIKGIPVSPDVYRRAPTPFGKKEFSVVVAAGGDGPEIANMTKQVLQAKLPENTVIHAVTGRNEKDFEELTELAKSHPNLKPYKFAPLKPMFQNSDLNVIRTHGTTFAETVVAGKPTVYYGPKGHPLDFQAKLTKDTAEYGHRHIGNPLAVGLDEIPKAITTAIRRYPSLAESSRKAKKDYGNPASDIVGVVTKAACWGAFDDELKKIADTISASETTNEIERIRPDDDTEDKKRFINRSPRVNYYNETATGAGLAPAGYVS